ncbi:NGFI-A-binding protein 1a [Brachyhypopomus gauderio]|uniref:NGFI-A-binding protein 1a n=1 Tax=Brachyhypopomus gauderio TaxID=698409 RepID=UPI004040F7A0
MSGLLPRSVGELQLYRVLQRANLLCYYAAFVQQGGDDVQQLCEAAEDEFLEIMALVGMATKPLHVRRLQKALRDWVTNPTLFNQPLTSLPVSSIPVYKLRDGSPATCSEQQKTTLPVALSPSSAEVEGGETGSGGARGTPDGPMEPEESQSPPKSCSPGSSGEATETLDPAVAQRVSDCVARLAPTLPKSDPVEVKERLRSNRRLSKALSHLGALSEGDPQREEEIRRYSAIYRHDCKREDARQLTMHELVMNEAAALLCLRDEALLTQREQLFSLARQISREVTYRHNIRTRPSGEEEEEEAFSPKRIKTEDGMCDVGDSSDMDVQKESAKECLAASTWKGDESIRHALQVQLQLQEMLHKRGVPPASIGYIPNITNSNPTHSPPTAESPPPSHGVNRSVFHGDIPLGRQLAHELKQHLKHRRKQYSQDEQRRLDRISGVEKSVTSENGTSPKEFCLVSHMKIKTEPEEAR